MAQLLLAAMRRVSPAAAPLATRAFPMPSPRWARAAILSASVISSMSSRYGGGAMASTAAVMNSASVC